MTTPDEAHVALQRVREAPARLEQEQYRRRRSSRALTVMAVLLVLNAVFVAAGDLPRTWELAVRGVAVVLILVGTMGGLISRRLAATLGNSVQLRYRGLTRSGLVLPAVLGVVYGMAAPALSRWVESTGTEYPSVVLAALLTLLLALELAVADRWLLRRSAPSR